MVTITNKVMIFQTHLPEKNYPESIFKTLCANVTSCIIVQLLACPVQGIK